MSKTEMPSLQTIISAVASAAATGMVVRSVAKDLIPEELQDQFFTGLRRFLSRFSNLITIVIDEYEGLHHNHLFEAAEIYLGSIISPDDTKRFRASKPEKEDQIKVSMEKDEELTDSFGGFRIRWRLLCKKTPGKYIADSDSYYGGTIPKSESRCFELAFHKKMKDKVVNEYLPYILEKSKILKEEQRTLNKLILKEELMNKSEVLNKFLIQRSIE